MRTATPFVPAVLVLAALVVNAQDRQPGRGPNLYSLEKESALGVGLAAEVLRQATPLDSVAVSDFVIVIGSRLSAQMPAAPFPYTFTVITGDVSNVTHEPIAVPGGRIFVPVELILGANDEAELAGMLAHSMVHISERHYTRQATRTQIADQATIPLVFMGGWAGYGAKQASGALIPVSMLQFQRTMETEADARAIQIISAAGFDPSALGRYISRVQAASPGTTGKFFAVLPPPEERASLMETAIRALPQRTYPVWDPDALGRIQAEVRRVAPVAEKERPLLRRN